MADNTTPAEARAALGLGDMGPFDLVDALKQDYLTRTYQAENAHREGLRTSARIHYGVMSALADILSRYYQSLHDCTEAEIWATRSIRYSRRSRGNNAVAESIGARMP